jgi:hypothetical protein
MESNNYERFITDTVEAMLPTFSDSKLVLTMCVSLSWTDYGFAEDGNTQVRDTRKFNKDVWLVFYRPNNYTKVLMREEKLSPFELEGKSIQFKQLSDHDSCWRSDGMRWLFESFVEAWDYFDKFEVEGREIDPMVGWDIFGGSPTYWLVESIEPVDKKERWTTDYIIKFDKKISLQKAAYKYMPDTEE